MKRKKMLAIVSLMAIGNCFALDLTKPITSSLWVANEHDTQVAIGPPVGSSAVTQPSWGVSQWGLPLNKRFRYDANSGWNNYQNEFVSSGGYWRLSNSTASLEYDPINQPWLNGVYRLSQGGNDLPCGIEYDYFLGPKGPLNSYGPLASNAPNGFVASAPLSTLSSLVIHAGLNVPYESVVPKCGGGNYDKVVYGIGIFLRNSVTNKTFFYQLNLRVSGNDYPVANGEYEGWDDNFGNVGISDNVVNSAPFITSVRPMAGRVAFSGVNILPRLKNVILLGQYPNGASGKLITYDSNPANWVIHGMYFGHYLWGGVVAVSEWDNVRLQAF